MPENLVALRQEDGPRGGQQEARLVSRQTVEDALAEALESRQTAETNLREMMAQEPEEPPQAPAGKAGVKAMVPSRKAARAKTAVAHRGRSTDVGAKDSE